MRLSAPQGDLRPVLRAGDARHALLHRLPAADRPPLRDRKSTRLNSSHANISYAVFCLKKKKPKYIRLSKTYPLTRFTTTSRHIPLFPPLSPISHNQITD